MKDENKENYFVGELKIKLRTLNNEFFHIGCIGTFNEMQLHQGLREYAVTSAMKDSRLVGNALGSRGKYFGKK